MPDANISGVAIYSLYCAYKQKCESVAHPTEQRYDALRVRGLASGCFLMLFSCWP